MDIILEQLRVVVTHLLEVRDNPSLIDRVAMKSSGQLVIDSAARHLFQRDDNDIAQRFAARASLVSNQQIKGRGMRKLGRIAESAITFVEHLDRGFDDRVNDLGRDFAASSREGFRLGDRVRDHVGLFHDLAILFSIGLRNR